MKQIDISLYNRNGKNVVKNVQHQRKCLLFANLNLIRFAIYTLLLFDVNSKVFLSLAY